MDKAVRTRILAKTRGVCATCGKGISKDNMTVDHYIPKSCGGPDRETNLFPMCRSCNLAKADTIYKPDSDVYTYVMRRYIDNMRMEYNTYISKHSEYSKNDENIDSEQLLKELMLMRKEIQNLSNKKGAEIEFNGTCKISI